MRGRCEASIFYFVEFLSEVSINVILKRTTSVSELRNESFVIERSRQYLCRFPSNVYSPETPSDFHCEWNESSSTGQRSGRAVFSRETIQDLKIFWQCKDFHRQPINWLKTRSSVGTLTVRAREAKLARESHRRKPPKPKGLALFQGRWRPPLGVKEVRARERGPGHRDGIQMQRGRRHRGCLLGEVSLRRATFDERG